MRAARALLGRAGRWAVVVATAALPGTALAQGFDVAGFLAGEARPFLEAPASPLQFDGVQASIVLEPELRYRTADRDHQFKIRPFLRVDSRDTKRTHFDLREAYWRFMATRDIEVLAGVNTVFWGVTESRHLVDVINQTDFVEDVDGEDKLGQPMIQVGWQRDWGRLDGFLLFGFREMTLPGVEGRLGLPLPVTDAAYYPDGKSSVDYALRYSHYVGDFDLGVHVFHGTNREAAFRVVPGDVPTDQSAQAVYRRITQVGVDVQWTRDAWLWKFEGLVRGGDGKTFGAAVVGLEYTLYQAFGAADLGLLAEYLRDDRDDTAALTFFDNDVFVGTRLALNDVWDTQALAGAVIDVEDGSIAARVEVERRLTNRLKLEVDGRFFANVAPLNNLALFRQDSFLNVRIAYGF